MGSIKIWSNRKITIVSLSLFMFVCAIVITGYIYMNECVKDESEAQNSRYEFTKLSTDLAETSDLLTREARQYAVTGEVSHLYNYWYEVRVDKTRDNVIEQLEKANSKQKEKSLLRQAKEDAVRANSAKSEFMARMSHEDSIFTGRFNSKSLYSHGKSGTAEKYSVEAGYKRRFAACCNR